MASEIPTNMLNSLLHHCAPCGTPEMLLAKEFGHIGPCVGYLRVIKLPAQKFSLGMCPLVFCAGGPRRGPLDFLHIVCCVCRLLQKFFCGARTRAILTEYWFT